MQDFLTRTAGLIGLVLYGFWESMLLTRSGVFKLTVFSNTIPLTPLLMLALACGLALVCLGRDKAPYISGLCGLGAGVLLMTATLLPQMEPFALLCATVLAGALLPAVLRLFFSFTTPYLQPLALACAHGLGEVCALTMGVLTVGGEGVFPVLSVLLLLLGGLLLRVRPHCVLPVAGDTTPVSPVWMLSPVFLRLLTLAALLFFLLHATHDYNFRLYANAYEGIPLWLRLSARVAFPVLALLAQGWGLMLLGIVSVGLSVFSPALDLFPGSEATYWAVYFLDTLGLHGGLFFFVIVFGHLSKHCSKPHSMCAIPWICFYSVFAVLWYFNEKISPDPIHMMLACLFCFGLLVVVMACLQRYWPWPHRDDVRSYSNTPPNQQHTATHTILPEEVSQAFAIAHALSPRETQVLTLICTGLSYAEMAKRLFIAENTVKIHVSRILKKSDTRSRTQLLGKLFSGNIHRHSSHDTPAE